MNRRTCSECVWWQHKERQEEVSPGGILMPRPSIGECRITAPRMQLWPCKDGDNWPRTEATDWCKEHTLRADLKPCESCGKPVGEVPFLFYYTLNRDDGQWGEPRICCSPECAEKSKSKTIEYYKNNPMFKVASSKIEQWK